MLGSKVSQEIAQWERGAVGPAAVEVGGEGVWLGLLAVGSLVERGGHSRLLLGAVEARRG